MKESIKIRGKVRKIGELQTYEKFKKKSLIVETDGEYPHLIEIEFVNKKEELLDLVSEGQAVEVMTNLRGREWINPQGEAKYFMSLQGWKIEIK